MSLRQRFNDDLDHEGQSSAAERPADDLAEIRRQAMEFQAAGDQAIESALSRNPRQFIEMNRQTSAQ